MTLAIEKENHGIDFLIVNNFPGINIVWSCVNIMHFLTPSNRVSLFNTILEQKICATEVLVVITIF